MCVYIYILCNRIEKKWMKGKVYNFFGYCSRGLVGNIRGFLFFCKTSNYLKLHGKVTFAGAQNEKRNFNKDLNRGRM